jgi:hypothetical protein
MTPDEDVRIEGKKVNALLAVAYSFDLPTIDTIAHLLAAIKTIDEGNRKPESDAKLSDILMTMLDEWCDEPRGAMQ